MFTSFLSLIQPLFNFIIIFFSEINESSFDTPSRLIVALILVQQYVVCVNLLMLLMVVTRMVTIL